MKNLLVLIIGFTLLISCGMLKKFTSTGEKEKKVETTESPKKETPPVKEKPPVKEELSQDEISQGTTQTSQEIGMLSFDKSNLPSDVKYQGKVVTGKRWTDKNGENYLVLTRTDVKKVKSKQPDFEEYDLQAELYGYHYVKSGDSYRLLWKINDFIKDCPFDLTLDFIPGSLSITDINNNGIAESTFLYKMCCRSDVSPSELKLMMHENEDKYALRGNMHIKMQGINEGGSYKIDKAFDLAPNGFLDYAKEQWKEFKMEKLN